MKAPLSLLKESKIGADAVEVLYGGIARYTEMYYIIMQGGLLVTADAAGAVTDADAAQYIAFDGSRAVAISSDRIVICAEGEVYDAAARACV